MKNGNIRLRREMLLPLDTLLACPVCISFSLSTSAAETDPTGAAVRLSEAAGVPRPRARRAGQLRPQQRGHSHRERRVLAAGNA